MELYDYQGNALGLNVETDKTLKVEDKPADAKTVGDLFDSIGVTAVEPEDRDIPELHITGTPPTSKDAGKVPVKVEYISRTLRFSEYATLKVQGNSSTGFPKKNYNINFFSDAACTAKSKHNFRGWGKQNKFTLKANWTDITHARNIVTARLWTDVVRSRTDFAALPANLRAAPNLGVIDGFFVKVYVNGVYHGRYTFNLPKDKWTFNMDDALESNVVLYSENYVSGCYKAAAVVDGTDWSDEIHEDSVPQSVIDRLNAYITFLNSSSDAAFVTDLHNYIDVDSFIDYYLFGYVSCAHDSFGKNQILLSYDDCPYIASVYDLDCTWALKFDGALLYPVNHAFEEYNGYTNGNVFYLRMPGLFVGKIRERYEALRNGPLSEANIIHRFEAFLAHMPQSLIEEDYAETTAGGAYVNIPSKDLTSLQQIRNYAAARLEYVDGVILT